MIRLAYLLGALVSLVAVSVAHAEVVQVGGGEVRLQQGPESEGYGYDKAVTFTLKSDVCSPASVRIGPNLRFETLDSCSEPWRRTGQAPALLPIVGSQRVDEEEASFTIGVAYSPPNISRVYRTTIMFEGRSLVRWLWAQIQHKSARKIWEGTDAFFNYCINKGKAIRSSNLRLYCVVPGRGSRFIYIEKTKPSWLS